MMYGLVWLREDSIAQIQRGVSPISQQVDNNQGWKVKFSPNSNRLALSRLDILKYLIKLLLRRQESTGVLQSRMFH